MRLRFETGGGESKFQSVTHLRMMDQWRCQAALLDKIYCLWMFFPSFHPFFYVCQSSVRSQRPNYLREWLPVFTHHISSWKGEKLRNILRIWQVMWLSLLLWTKRFLWYGSSLILFVIFFSFFIPHSTCKDKEIIFREANVLANLYCRMIRVSLFLFFTSLWNIGRKNWWHNWSCFLIL